MVDHAVILAGGSGTRLWPASVKVHPKQFMEAEGGTSFLGTTLKRALALDGVNKVAIVAHKDQAPGMRAELRKLPPEERKRTVLLLEPEARNTAPALMLAAVWAREEGPEEASLLVLAADHLVTPQEAFAADVEKADKLARKGYLVPFGIPPTRPETGYGYLQAGEVRDPGRLVKKFKEKPDEETARQFLAAGDHYWNSGMFVFTTETFLSELKAYAPDVAAAFEGFKLKSMMNGTEGFSEMSDPDSIAEMYSRAPRISVDYAVMEKSDRVAMVDTSFQWNDVGSWDEMSELPEPGGQTVIRCGAGNCYVNADMPVALCGVEDLVVVVRNGSVLVSRKGAGQMVKNVVEALKAQGRTDLL